MLKKRAFLLLALLTIVLPLGVHAAGENIPSTERLEKAKVIAAGASRPSPIAGTNVTSQAQTLTVEVLEGPEKGLQGTFENDFTQLKAGDVVYVPLSPLAQISETFQKVIMPIIPATQLGMIAMGGI